MANTLTDLKDVRIAQAALLPWMTELMPLSVFSTNFSPSPSDKGDTVKVPVVGAPTAASDFAGTYMQDIDSEASSVPVVLNKHKFKTVHLTAKEAATTAVPLLEKLVATAAQQLAIDVLTDIFSCVKKASFKTAADVASNLAQPGVVEARINRLAGFDVYETDCVPDNGENLAGFAAHSSAVAVAMRYLQPIANYDEAGAVTDPVTGLTFGYLRYTDTASNKVLITLECLYGYEVVRSAALQRISITTAGA